MKRADPPSNLEWKTWGKRDPLFGVAAWPGRQKGGPNPWTDEEFYRLGEAEWRVFEREWRTYGLHTQSCLEIGCGAGRITAQLVKIFDQVLAVDVSSEMIEYARQRIGRSNVQFFVTNGIDLPLNPHSVTAVFSSHVFQHLDSLYYVDQYFQHIMDVLAPGGTMMIHVPIYHWHPRTPSVLRWLFDMSERWYDAKVRLNRWFMRLGIQRQLMRMQYVPLSHLARSLSRMGWADIQVRILFGGGDQAFQPFVLARKG